jgi:cobalamin biosynthesis protein CbiG
LRNGPLHVIALTRPGAKTAARIAAAFATEGAVARVPERYLADAPGAEPFSEPVADLVARLWNGAGGFFLVVAAGIAVRTVAPHLRAKRSDPPVVVVDGEGRFAVPILAGHLGGANRLAEEAARRLGLTPVITTATDAAGKPAAEVWAEESGFRLENPEAVVLVNASWASGEPVGLYLDPALGPLTEAEILRAHVSPVCDEAEAAAFPGALLVVSHRESAAFANALRVRPPVLALGVGCRKGADPAEVENGVRNALRAAGLSPLSAFVVASVDAKAGEPALTRLANALGVPFATYPAGALAAFDTPSPSARVAEAVGTPSVSEAAALASSEGGRLLLPKVARRTWTLAAALRRYEA